MIKKLVISLVLVCGIVFSFSNAGIAGHSAANATVNKVANIIKKNLVGMDAETTKSLMMEKYMHLQLMDTNGNWRVQELNNVSDYLLPSDLDETKLNAFVDEVAKIALQNDYLRRFLARAKNKSFDYLENQVDDEGATVFPDVVAYAIALNRLTIVMQNDWKVLNACVTFWRNFRIAINLDKYLSSFVKIKLISVELAMDQFKEYHTTGTIPGNTGKMLVPLNIMEAVIEGSNNGYKNNKDAGIALALNNAGSLTHDPNTGAGPSGWSDDKKSVVYYAPFPLEWANLYTTWNMAFVSDFTSFPYVMCKLLIPQVNNYQDKPEEYIYNRAIALYTHLHYTLLTRAAGNVSKSNHIEWNDPELTSLWGKVNKQSAKKYLRKIKRAKRK